MAKKTIKFEAPLPLARTRDAKDVWFGYTIINSSFIGTPEEDSKTEEYNLKVGVSRTLTSCWGFNESELIKVLFEYGKRHIFQKLIDKTLVLDEELDLTTANTPTKCPFDPNRIDEPTGATYEKEIPEESIIENETEIQLAGAIIDTRDNINALFKEAFKKPLLILYEERSIFQLLREANTIEELSYRVASLGEMAGNLNESALRDLTGIKETETKSISLLEKFLKDKGIDTNGIIPVMRNLKKMRQGFPVHGDYAEGVVSAYKFFKIEYPVKNYKHAWLSLMKAYLSTLNKLIKEIKLII
jgi:hypothetical protein